MNSIIHRLKQLEKIKPNNLVLLVDDNGAEKQCSAKEFAENPQYAFIKVLQGNNLDDVDLIVCCIDMVVRN